MKKQNIFADVAPQRRRLMANVKSNDTKPEMFVRRMLHARGYRYRLHLRGLPGTPDLVFPAKKKVVFVHGCFWHRHPGCARSTVPKTRTDYWHSKFEANIERDARKSRELEALGWNSLVVWECEIREPASLLERIEDFLS